MENNAELTKRGFLSLPPEVRNMVYSELFNKDIRLVCTVTREGDPAVAFQNTARPLLGTCKTIHTEARRLLEENTTLYIDEGLIRAASFNPLPHSKSVGVESFTRKMRIIGALSFCGFSKINLSAYQQLRCLEFRLATFACCVRKRLGIRPAAAGQTTADILQRGWLDDASRGWGLSRRIEQIEVTVDSDDEQLYHFRITIRPARSASRRVGRVNVSYQED